MTSFIKISILAIFLQLIIITGVSAADVCTCNGEEMTMKKGEGCEVCIAKDKENCRWNEKKTCDSKPGGNSDSITLPNPLPGINTPQEFIGQIIKAILGIIGSLALLMFIWGGFLWMTSAGDSGKVEKGKQTMLWAAIGLVVIFSSYSLVDFVIRRMIGA